MAHQLTITKFGRAELFYVGDVPWHGLGTQLPARVTSREALAAAGLDWIVAPEPLFLHHPDGTQTEVTEAVANVRQDTREVLGVVTPDFKLFQNLQTLQLIDEVVGQAHAIFETAGSLRGGRQVFATAKLPTQYVVGPDDALDQYLLIRNGHDGSCKIHLRFTPVRVICANTLGMALDRVTPYQYSIVHSKQSEMRVQDVRKALSLSVKYFDLMGQRCEALTSVSITQKMETAYLLALIPNPEPKKDDEPVTISQLEMAQATRDTISYLFREGSGAELVTARGTAWGLLNAATEYIDHVAPVTRKGTLKTNGLEATLFGSGETLRQRAWDEALALLK